MLLYHSYSHVAIGFSGNVGLTTGVITKTLICFLYSKNSLKFVKCGVLFVSVILSQPFLFGGEARTVATVLLFLNYIIIYGLHNLIEYIKSKKDTKYIFKDFQLKHSNSRTNVFVYCIPFLALSFFLYKGLNNNFDYLTNVQEGESVTCPEGYNLKNIVFNDKADFI